MSTLYRVRLNPTLRDGDRAEENGVKASFIFSIMKSATSDTFYVTPKRRLGQRIAGWYEGNPNGGNVSYSYHWSWLLFLEDEPDVS